MQKINVPFTILAVVGALAPVLSLFLILINGGELTLGVAAVCDVLFTIGIVAAVGALVVAGVRWRG